MEKQTYTVFWTDGFQTNNAVSFDGLSLQDLIDKGAREFGGRNIVAWAAEGPIGYGGSKTWGDLRAESIAAGRTIDCVDGRYIPRGVPAEEPRVIEIKDVLVIYAEDAFDDFDDENAAMIQRDGPAKPAVVLPAPVASTAKPAIVGLLKCSNLEPHGFALVK